MPHHPAHEHYMRRAIQVATESPHSPFGAVLVDRIENVIVAEGGNRVNENPISHAEIEAITLHAKKNNPRWETLCLYTTAEPCCMCQSAILWAGIPQVVYGTSIATLSKLGWKQFRLSAAEIVQAADFADCELIGGVLQDQCEQLYGG